jgi:hypothetical protein
MLDPLRLTLYALPARRSLGVGRRFTVHVVNGNGLFILGKMNDIANCDVKRTV